MTRSFDVFSDLRLNKQLNKQSRGWWFQTLSRSLCRHCNEIAISQEYMGGSIDKEKKGCKSDTMLYPLFILENYDLNHDLPLNLQIFKVKFKTVVFQERMERLIRNERDISRMMITLCKLNHDFDLGCSRLNFQNNYIWGISTDITSVHGKKIIIH